MDDKKTFRIVFNFFTKYRDMIGHMDRNNFWASAAEEMGRLSADLGNTDFAMDMFAAIYEELSRRDCERQA